jgi:hypothetical protein
MTEQEWLACTEPHTMLEFLRSRASDRKLRLLACAYCRTLFPFNLDRYSRNAVKTAERYADGEASPEKLRFAEGSARRSAQVRERRHRHEDPDVEHPEDIALYAVLVALSEDPSQLTWGLRSIHWTLSLLRQQSGVSQSPMIDLAFHRDIIGPLPFRPVALNPAWLSWHDATIPQLARAVYEDRGLPSGHLGNHRMAILADALEDAGCTDQDILGHLRGPGPHVRGCFAVDLLLGKE